jgi:hypothetical protein
MAVLSTLQFGGLCILALILFQFITSYLSSPLKKIPGPFFAKFTNLWRFWLHYRQTHIETHQALHKKYGKAVRVGPNVVSVSDAGLIKTIYNTRGTFVKVSLLGMSRHQLISILLVHSPGVIKS